MLLKVIQLNNKAVLLLNNLFFLHQTWFLMYNIEEKILNYLPHSEKVLPSIILIISILFPSECDPILSSAAGGLADFVLLRTDSPRSQGPTDTVAESLGREN